MGGTADELRVLEEAGWRALAAGEGAAFYGEHMEPDGVMVLPGGVLDHAAVLASLAAPQPWSSWRLEGLRVVRLSPDAAALVYTAHAQRERQPGYVADMTSVYRRDHSGGWRLALHRQTPRA